MVRVRARIRVWAKVRVVGYWASFNGPGCDGPNFVGPGFERKPVCTISDTLLQTVI